VATRVSTTLIDDTDGGEADETLTFGLDGVSYEIDLSSDNAESLRESIAAFVRSGRRTGGRSTYRPKPAVGLQPVRRTAAAAAPAASETGYTKQDRTNMRAWATSQGYNVGPRGRIKEEIVLAWEAAGKPVA
jgi:hypothetical protein